MLDHTLTQLTELDSAITRIETGDLDRLAASLSRRTALVQAAAAEIARLRDSAAPIPPGTRERLEKSTGSGMQAMRQIILAKHLLTSELTRLKQEQRLLEALSCGQQQVGHRVELSA